MGDTPAAGGARLIRAEVQNVLGVRLAEVAFAADGGLTVVGGANGAGKSSLLDAIRWAIDGVKPKGKVLLRHGAAKGFVRLELDGEVVEIRRGVTANGTTVRLSGPDGAELKKPQGVLDTLVGAFGVDPTAFLLLDDAAQTRRVQEVMGLDFEDLDAQHKQLYELRTEAFRRARDAEGEFRALAGVTDPGEGNREPVEMSALLEQVRAADEEETQRIRDVAELDRLRARRDTIQAKIAELTAELEEVVAEGKRRRAQVDAAAAKAGTPAAVLKARLVDAEKNNARAAAWQKREAARSKLNDLEKVAADLSDQLTAVNVERAQRIAAARVSVEGVEIRDGAVWYQDAPLAEASDGQRLRAAFEIAAAGAPDLRVLFLRHGALLDDGARRAVADLARARGYTVILETVGTAGIDVLVEDGVVK